LCQLSIAAAPALGRSHPAARVIYRSARPIYRAGRSMMDGIGKHWTTARSKSTRATAARPRRAARATAGPGVDADCVPLGRPPLRYQAPADAAERCRLIATRDRWSATTGPDNPRRNVRDAYDGRSENAQGQSSTMPRRSLTSDHPPHCRYSTSHVKSSLTYRRRIKTEIHAVTA